MLRLRSMSLGFCRDLREGPPHFWYPGAWPPAEVVVLGFNGYAEPPDATIGSYYCS